MHCSCQFHILSKLIHFTTAYSRRSQDFTVFSSQTDQRQLKTEVHVYTEKMINWSARWGTRKIHHFQHVGKNTAWLHLHTILRKQIGTIPFLTKVYHIASQLLPHTAKWKSLPLQLSCTQSTQPGSPKKAFIKSRIWQPVTKGILHEIFKVCLNSTFQYIFLGLKGLVHGYLKRLDYFLQ